MKTEVIIVGAGPAGLATAACLNALSVPNIIIEKEDTYAHLWKYKAYDRLKLHLGKEFCSLPLLPHPDSAPKYIPKDEFVRYLDEYVDKFSLSPVCNTAVEWASYDKGTATWTVGARSTVTGTEEEYEARFLVVATGENAEGFVPDVPGLKGFDGDVKHSSEYKSGEAYSGKEVLVVGCGNSGMEIAYDLSNHGANTSIVIRSPFHVMTKELIYIGMCLVKILPIGLVDYLILMLSWILYRNLSKYGIVRPALGPLALKAVTGRSAVIDVGTIGRIKSGDIKVVKELESVDGNMVTFKDGKAQQQRFDAIIFATGYKSTAKNWLREDGWLLNDDGFPMERFPNHWRGRNGLYCVGLSRRGLAGISMDALKVADDIHMKCRINPNPNPNLN